MARNTRRQGTEGTESGLPREAPKSPWDTPDREDDDGRGGHAPWPPCPSSVASVPFSHVPKVMEPGHGRTDPGDLLDLVCPYLFTRGLMTRPRVHPCASVCICGSIPCFLHGKTLGFARRDEITDAYGCTRIRKDSGIHQRPEVKQALSPRRP